MPADHMTQDADGRAGVADAPGEVRRRLLAVEPGRRRKAVLLRHLSGLAMRLLGDPPAEIDPAAPLTALGFSSARLLQLRAELESSLEVALPASLGWQFPTLEALAPYLAERMGIELEARQARPPESLPQDSLSQAASDTAPDELSDADLVALLVTKIEQIDEALEP